MGLSHLSMELVGPAAISFLCEARLYLAGPTVWLTVNEKLTLTKPLKTVNLIFPKMIHVFTLSRYCFINNCRAYS